MIASFTLLFVTIMLSAVNGQNANSVSNSFSTGQSASWSSNAGSGNGPLVVRILVSNGSIMNLSKGSGSTSVSRVNDQIFVEANGQKFQSNDVKGPYVITNEPDGVLKSRPMTPEDEKAAADFRKEQELMQQQLQQQMQQMNQNMQNWQRNFQNQMQSFQQNLQNNMQQMSANLQNMFGGRNRPARWAEYNYDY